MNESKNKTAVGFLAGVVAAALLFGLATTAFSYRTETASDAPAAIPAMSIAAPATPTRMHRFRPSAATGDVAFQQPPVTSPDSGQQLSGGFPNLSSLRGQLPTSPPAAQGFPIGSGAYATTPQMPMTPVTVQRSRSKVKSVAIVGGSAGAGAAIGAVAGGKKGAVIGAVSGAVAGLFYDRLTANKK